MTQLEKLAGKWVMWNCKEITGDEFALAFRKLFPEASLRAWRKDVLKRKILNEMVV